MKAFDRKDRKGDAKGAKKPLACAGFLIPIPVDVIYTAPLADKLVYTVQGASLNTTLSLAPGSYNTVVEEWDYCGGASFTPVTIKVGGSTLKNIQASGGWKGWGELAPAYAICSSCSPQVTWKMTQTGGATQFDIGGTVPYSDVLWSNPVIGQGSSQGLPDNNHTLVPNLRNFIYDAWFFSDNLPASQVLEFDVSQYFSGLGIDPLLKLQSKINFKCVGQSLP